MKYAIGMYVTREAAAPPRSRQASVHFGEAHLYVLTPPAETRDGTPPTYVLISASTVLGEPETYAFASDANGFIGSYSELPMSQKGTLDHHRILRDEGYAVLSPTAMMHDAIARADYDALAVASDQAEEMGLSDHAEASRQLLQSQVLEPQDPAEVARLLAERSRPR